MLPLLLFALILTHKSVKVKYYCLNCWSKNVKICLAKAFKLESDFETSIFRCGIVKILVNPSGFTAFLPCPPKNPLFTKFCDLKGTAFLSGFW